MILLFISLLVLILFVLIAIRVSFSKKETSVEEFDDQVINASGMYSIVRKSPRENICQFKPGAEEIRKYLKDQNVNNSGNVAIPNESIDATVENWIKSLNDNIKIVEQGDGLGVGFYYYDFTPNECPVCLKYLNKGQFVTREEIFKFPNIIPPFHIGCTCTLVPYSGKENLHGTTEIGMQPLFKNEVQPQLPEWKTISSSNAVRGTVV